MQSYVQRQIDERQKVWHEAKAMLDAASSEERDLSAEESATYNRLMEELDSRARVIEQFQKDQEREEARNEAIAGFEAQARPLEVASTQKSDADIVRELLMGERRSVTFEKRDVLTSSTGSPVPTSFYDKVVAILTYISPLVNAGTRIRTTGGETLQIPSTSVAGTALIKAEAAAITEGDPVFNALVSMSAFKASQLLQVSREMLSDNGLSGPDLLGFLAEQIGTSMGVLIDNKLTLGTGTVEPTGIVTSAGSGVTGATYTPTGDNLIDLVYSVGAAYRARPACAFLASTSAIQAIRKLKDTTNQYLFEPSLQAGQPDRLLGYPLLESSQMAATGSAAKSVIFGDMSQFYVREVGGMELARSDDFAFSQDLVSLRATYRFDSRLIQTSAVKFFIGVAS